MPRSAKLLLGHWCVCQCSCCLGAPSPGSVTHMPEQPLLTLAPGTDCPAFWNFHTRYQVLDCGCFCLTFSKIERKPFSLSSALQAALELESLLSPRAEGTRKPTFSGVLGGTIAPKPEHWTGGPKPEFLSCFSSDGRMCDPDPVTAFPRPVSSCAHDKVGRAGFFHSFLPILTQYKVTHSNLYLISSSPN